MRNGLALAASILLAAGCASMRTSEPAPRSAGDFKPQQVRRPAIFVSFGLSAAFSKEEEQSMPAEYEGALLEGLNARAVLATHARVLGKGDPKLDGPAALARARELGADHAVLVVVRGSRHEPSFCRETRRPFRAPATTWAQTVEVLRTSDGAERLTVPAFAGLEVNDLEPDCANPRASRRRPPSEALAEAVTKLLDRVVGP